MEGARGAASFVAQWSCPETISEPGDAAASSAPASAAADCRSGLVAALRDDLSRDVYCILGMPIDAIEMPAVLDCIGAVTGNRTPFVISTPNLNFLVNSQNDPEFRESLLFSDLCPTDGTPIVWIARLLGIPIKHRIAGSDIFEELRVRPRAGRPLRVFLFGSTETVAAAAAATLNDLPIGLSCTGWACPGFGTIDELSQDRFIDEINASGADFLVVALGAMKGQLWLKRNHDALQIPLRAHLGATINFQAGTVYRAPLLVQKLGFEWLWRIKEEPHLWRRYWHDGCVLLQLMLTSVLPMAVAARWQRLRYRFGIHDLIITQTQSHESVTLSLYGVATARQADKAVAYFRDAVATGKATIVDFSQTHAIDARFLGLLLMLRKQLKGQGASLKFAGVSSRLARTIRLHGAGFLLSAVEVA